jgi:hypothetical protein
LAAQLAAGKIPAAKIVETQRIIFNQRLDAVVTAVLALMILVLIAEASVQWFLLLTKRKTATLHEAPYTRTAWQENYSGAASGDD